MSILHLWRPVVAAAFLCLSTPLLAAIQLIPVVTGGLSSPLFVGHAGDGSNRLFIEERGGIIRVLQPGASVPTVFLDISPKVLSGNEQGLLGLAFHPQYPANGRFFVFYTRPGDGTLVIAEYRASANPNVADPTERILLTIAHPAQANHNGGMMAFGPDGYLYIGVGDGGSANDPPNNAQNIDILLGKILRIDVDHPDPVAGTLYSSPPTNPFVNAPGRDEIFAFGLRNPWRFSFDRLSGQQWVGDVGQGVREEVDTPIVNGGNYGWRVFEGTTCTNLGPAPCIATNYIAPVLEYGHSGGRCSITGGYVYRGGAGALPPGTYVFADYCTGEIFTAVNGAPSLLLDTAMNISSFGEDEAGELYVVGLGGTVHRIAANPMPTATTLTTSGSPAAAGALVTFTATVTGTSPSGIVNFIDSGTSIAGCNAIALAGSGNTRTALCSTSTLAAGVHSIVASYGGDSANAGSSSSPLSQVITGSTASTVWVEDALPTGAVAAGNEPFAWISANPTPYSGTLAHRSGILSGFHQHYFSNSTSTLSVGAGDTLFTYVYLDPANPPREVMLQFYDGSWAHRAYWGANLIELPASFRGPLPAAGQWVRLEVPASAMNLEGRVLTGMSFALYDGRATWDYSGKTALSGGNQPPIASFTATPSSTTVGTPIAFSAAASSDPDGSITSYAWNFGDGTTGSGVSVSKTYAAAGVYTVTLTVTDNGGLTGTATKTVAVTGGGGVTTVWVEDALPSGAVAGGNEPFAWISANPAPYSGALAHRSGILSGFHQHYFSNATSTLSVGVGDTLFTYVYLDPANPPREVMLQFYDGSWAHRAYWGANLIELPKTFRGPLPAAGQWVRLEVPASAMNLEGRMLTGMSFALYDGRATWDYAGKLTP